MQKLNKRIETLEEKNDPAPVVPFIIYENRGGKLFMDGIRCEEKVKEHNRRVREIRELHNLDPKDMPVSFIEVDLTDFPE